MYNAHYCFNHTRCIGRSVKNLQSFFLIKAAFFVNALFFFLDFQCARGSILAFLNCSNFDTPSKSIIMLCYIVMAFTMCTAFSSLVSIAFPKIRNFETMLTNEHSTTILALDSR
jgi:ABC-type polysaccharide/polyol phosphate export permease